MLCIIIRIVKDDTHVGLLNKEENIDENGPFEATDTNLLEI